MKQKKDVSNKSSLFKSGIAIAVSLLFFVNTLNAQNALKTGSWRGSLALNDFTQLPINFVVQNALEIYSIIFYNAEEEIIANEILVRNDSLYIKMPVFDSEFLCKINENSISGVWVNHARKEKNEIPFNANFISKTCGNEDYSPSKNQCSLQGNWECDFSPNSKDASKALGVFNQATSSKNITGTFATETGDYRYLSGAVEENNSFALSCFDGAHAFLFTGKIKGDSIVNGHFYSGLSGHETWIAKRNNQFQLRNPDSLTYLKTGFTKVDFSFKNLEGKAVSINDVRYKNKVVVIQLMGTWCPNCMDETKFLAGVYQKNNNKGLEVIALAFERTDNFDKAVKNVTRLKNRFNANYDFLITMKTGAAQASEALPMLNAVMAFPTTIYIDKKGFVRKIYTGFYGPATGNKYIDYVLETNRFIEKLLSE